MHWYIYNINQYIGNFKVDHVCIWSYSSSSVWRPFAILIIVVVIKQSHSFFWIWRTFICMSMLAIIDNDISFFAGQIIYAVLYGVTSAAYVLLTTLVGLLSCGDIMIHILRFWWWYLWYIHTLIHFYDKSLSTLQNNARCLPIFLALTPSPMHLACSFFSRWPPHL